jgi:hypothetical protein
VFQMAALYPAKREERRWNVGHLVRAFKEDDRLYKQIPAHEVLRKSIARLLDEHAFVDNYGIPISPSICARLTWGTRGGIQDDSKGGIAG